MSTTVLLPVFAIGVCLAAVIGLYQLARAETRAAGEVKLAPKLLLGLLAGVVYVFYLDDAMAPPSTNDTVRRLFHLPDDVTLVRHGRYGAASCYSTSMNTRRSVHFTPEQYAKYVGSIHDPSVWRPVMPPHYVAEKSSVRFSDDALVWQTFPEPPWLDKQQLVWSIAGAQVRRGLAQCYEFTREQTPAQANGHDGRTAYAATACNPRARPRTPAGGARVTAALDSDTQRLDVTLHFDSKPDYCNNRVSQWLQAALGIVPQQGSK